MLAMAVAGVAQVKNIAENKSFNLLVVQLLILHHLQQVVSSEAGATTSPTQAPSFNVVGQSGFNQIAGALGQQPPTQAYVVAGDVTTAQQLQNNTITTSNFLK